jgi:hypothetical protein
VGRARERGAADPGGDVDERRIDARAPATSLVEWAVGVAVGAGVMGAGLSAGWSWWAWTSAGLVALALAVRAAVSYEHGGWTLVLRPRSASLVRRVAFDLDRPVVELPFDQVSSVVAHPDGVAVITPGGPLVVPMTATDRATWIDALSPVLERARRAEGPAGDVAGAARLVGRAPPRAVARGDRSWAARLAVLAWTAAGVVAFGAQAVASAQLEVLRRAPAALTDAAGPFPAGWVELRGGCQSSDWAVGDLDRAFLAPVAGGTVRAVTDLRGSGLLLEPACAPLHTRFWVDDPTPRADDARTVALRARTEAAVTKAGWAIAPELVLLTREDEAAASRQRWSWLRLALVVLLAPILVWRSLWELRRTEAAWALSAPGQGGATPPARG